MKNWLEVIALVVLIGIGIYFSVMLGRRDQARDEEIKALKENVGKVVTYDSIISGIERKMLDSLKAANDRFETFKTLQHDENTRLRSRNYALEKRFRDLNLSDRPDF